MVKVTHNHDGFFQLKSGRSPGSPASTKICTSSSHFPETNIHNLPHQVQSSMSIDTNRSWTRVESRKKGRLPKRGQATASDDHDHANVGTETTSSPLTGTDLDNEDGDEDKEKKQSMESEMRRPLAERMLPKARKTGVE
ncbi:hypothetical protein H0H93_009119, partial [Arthromyces matolae]